MSVPVGACLQADVGELLVDGDPVVVEAGCLEDDARRAHHHRHREDPEEQAVQHHRHVLPVLLHLKQQGWNIHMRGRIIDTEVRGKE